MDRRTSLAVLLLMSTSAGACTDRIAGPAGQGPSPQVLRTVQAAVTQDGPAVVLESRDEEGAETRAVGGTLTAESTQPTGPITVYIHPNGGYRGAPSRRQIHNADPTREVRFTITCIINGTPQSVAKAQVDSVRQRNYGTPVGGHGSVHDFTNTGTGRPRGRWNPASGEAPGGVFVSTVTAEIASGDEKIAIWYKVTDPASPCDGLETSKEFRSVVRVPGLVPVAQDTNIALSPPSSNHPGSTFWYLAPAANTATVLMAEAHREAYGTDLLLTAANLAQGGINDIHNDWHRSHAEHRVGMEIDVDDQAGNSMSRLRAIAAMGKPAGFAACELHGEPVHNHVHCRLRTYR
jgi:hypothetical protein